MTGYAPGQNIPLGGYAALMGVFGGALTALLASRRGRRSPARISNNDLALLGVATHRVTRVLTHDWVTAPVRAPFTRYQGEGKGGGEVEEEARGSGLRQAAGELLTCRFCAGPWVGMAFVGAYLFRPRETRTVASIFTVATASDFLHQVYDRLQD